MKMSNLSTAHPENPLELAASLMPAVVSEGRLNELMETVRIFLLRAGESVTLLRGEGEEILQVFSGRVVVEGEGDGPVTLATDRSGDNRLSLTQSIDYIYVRAETRAILGHIDQSCLDFLLLWESMSQGESDPELRRRMDKVPRAQAFRRLPAEAVQEAVRRMERVEVKAGEEIVRQYEEGDAYYLIDEGEVEVWAEEFPGDDAELVAVRHEGDAFGEYALVTGKQRGATVRMRTDGALLRLNKEDFQRLIGHTMIREVVPDVAKAMLKDGYKLLDVRFEEEFDESYIPGCELMPLSNLRDALCELDPQGRYIVYCRSGLRSAVGALILSQHGIEAVSLRGGIARWPYDTESNLPPPPPKRPVA
jgi:rhodanese-related sulfurtransferase